MTKTETARVVNATVSIEGKRGHGQGVLVTGGFILTAAHCISLLIGGGKPRAKQKATASAKGA